MNKQVFPIKIEVEIPFDPKDSHKFMKSIQKLCKCCVHIIRCSIEGCYCTIYGRCEDDIYEFIRILNNLMETSQDTVDLYYLVKIKCSKDVIGMVYHIVNRRHGWIINEVQYPNSSSYDIEAIVGVNGLIGLPNKLQYHTLGQASLQHIFYQIVNYNSKKN